MIMRNSCSSYLPPAFIASTMTSPPTAMALALALRSDVNVGEMKANIWQIEYLVRKQNSNCQSTARGPWCAALIN